MKDAKKAEPRLSLDQACLTAWLYLDHLAESRPGLLTTMIAEIGGGTDEADNRKDFDDVVQTLRLFATLGRAVIVTDYPGWDGQLDLTLNTTRPRPDDE